MMNKLSSPSHCYCGHWFVRHGICLACKSKPSLVQGLRIDYLLSGLHLSQEAVAFTKRLTTLVSLYEHKKLHLVLDLDQTLVDTVRVSDLSEAEKYLIEGGRLGSIQDNQRLIKVRPFVADFLKEANELFNMYVYTNADLSYAQGIVRKIDPNKTYFGDRVITRHHSPDTKTLDLVLADERAIVIVDDRVSVWPHHKRNLLHVKKYHYFKHNGIDSASRPSLAEMKLNESKSKGALAHLLKFLKEVHYEFFNCAVEEELDSKDVRLLIKGPFKLHGC